MFAVARIEVRGGSPEVTRQVDAALASLVGRPLVGLDGAAVLQQVDALPTVVGASYDRAFPHTLRIYVVPERPVAVLRRGAESWLVSARGRVMEHLAPSASRAAAHLDPDATPVADGRADHGGRRRPAARAAGLAGGSALASTPSRTAAGRSCSTCGRASSSGSATAGDIRLKLAVAGSARGAAGRLDVPRRQRPGPAGVGADRRRQRRYKVSSRG